MTKILMHELFALQVPFKNISLDYSKETWLLEAM